MDIVLREVWDFSQAYTDDVAICSALWSNHCDHLVSVLQKLQDTGLTVKRSECEWGVATPAHTLGLLLATVEDGQKSVRSLLFRTSPDRRPRVTSDPS